jgi:hypothetical protein
MEVASHHVFLDESGTHAGSSIMTMAGYVFEAHQSIQFTRRWQKDLKKFGLPYAHQKDCGPGNGPYRGMPKEMRVIIQKKLIQHIRFRTLFGFSVSLDPEHYTRTIGRDADLPTAYSFMVLACVHEVAHWADQRNCYGKFSYFFEAGHAHQSEANIIMNALADHNQQRRDEYRYLSHSFVRKEEAVPLQAADMLAWHVHHYYTRKRNMGQDYIRADFRALVRAGDYNRDYTEESLETYRTGWRAAFDQGGIS